MFAIRLQMAYAPDLSGLDALDRRRVLGLPDGVKLHHSAAQHTTTRSVEVSEGFARLHFGRTDTTVYRSVDPALLIPSDVCLTPTAYQGDALRFRDDITDDRIRELWLAGSAD